MNLTPDDWLTYFIVCLLCIFGFAYAITQLPLTFQSWWAVGATIGLVIAWLIIVLLWKGKKHG